jgi:type I restriction enzyme S subunit
MRWPKVPLKSIAPEQGPNISFSPDELVWYLTLDQIESHTGNIAIKKIAPASAAGKTYNVFDDGNVLYSKLRPYLNKVVCPTEPGIATSELVPLRPRKDLLDRRYLTYYLRSNHFLEFAKVAVEGTVMPRIKMTKFWNHRIPLPPLSEQNRIVEILDEANTLRSTRSEADAKAARIQPAFFYKMFGDPFTNPRGLVKKRLGDLIKVRSGKLLPAKNLDPAGHYPVYGSNGINGYHTEFMFEEPVIVIGCFGNYCGEVRYSEPNCWVTDKALFVAEQPKDLHPRYLAEALRIANLRQYAGRAFRPHISWNQIYSIEIIVPSPDEQEMFAKKIIQIHRLENYRQDAYDYIEKLFSVLLHRAFTGDLTANWRNMRMKELLAEIKKQTLALERQPAEDSPFEIKSDDQIDHSMFNKAALAAYIVYRCKVSNYPLRSMELSNIFYLVNKIAEKKITEKFAKRTPWPLNVEIKKLLSLAQKNKWLILGMDDGDLTPVIPGGNVLNAIEQAHNFLGKSKAKVDEMLDLMKGWGYCAIERWAIVLDASFELTSVGQFATVEGIKCVIRKHPEWETKLSREEFSDRNIEAALYGLRSFGFITSHLLTEGHYAKEA